ncbi:MAG: glycosyl transferase group 1 [Burkholderiaceae bacterium]|nr:glycosyl transferase group 1 [Burkholderiaceae bacterium]
MRILIAATVTPFLHGGADYHIQGLLNALLEAGHEAELLRLPFRFEPEEDVLRTMSYAGQLDMAKPNGIAIDRVISLQFPAWGIRHPDHWAWIMHQHRAVYELHERLPPSAERNRLRDDVVAFDNRTLGRAQRLFANSQRVADRLVQYNGLHATPLYHPPTHAERFFCAEPEPYIFYPSRIESLKRQSLLVEAAQYMRSPLRILIAGDGGQLPALHEQIARLGVADRVRLLGRISEAEKLAFYAHSTAVAFPAFDEDYGYITLEAMLSSKPVLTCTDSGGPLEFIRHEENGWVEAPDARALAERLDWLHAHRNEVIQLGQAARASYTEKNISWQNVVSQLTQK